MLRSNRDSIGFSVTIGYVIMSIVTNCGQRWRLLICLVLVKTHKGLYLLRRQQFNSWIVYGGGQCLCSKLINDWLRYEYCKIEWDNWFWTLYIFQIFKSSAEKKQSYLLFYSKSKARLDHCKFLTNMSCSQKTRRLSFCKGKILISIKNIYVGGKIVGS